jgi:hypothetical protein
VGRRDDADRHLQEPQLAGGAKPLVPVQDDPGTRDLEWCEEAASVDVDDECPVLVRSELGNEVGPWVRPQPVRCLGRGGFGAAEAMAYSFRWPWSPPPIGGDSSCEQACVTLLLMAAPRPRKPRTTRRRYRWALHLSERDPRVLALSDRARAGFDYACELGENADQRSRGALRGEVPERVTVEQIAREEGLSPSSVYSMLRQARIELFGKDLSDSAIYYRLRRDREQGIPAARPCAEPGCRLPLPGGATARRRYCDFHLASHARVRRYRERQRKS